MPTHFPLPKGVRTTRNKCQTTSYSLNVVEWEAVAWHLVTPSLKREGSHRITKSKTAQKLLDASPSHTSDSPWLSRQPSPCVCFLARLAKAAPPSPGLVQPKSTWSQRMGLVTKANQTESSGIYPRSTKQTQARHLCWCLRNRAGGGGVCKPWWRLKMGQSRAWVSLDW